MKDLIQNAILAVRDPSVNQDLPALAKGVVVENFSLLLSNKRTTDLNTIIQNGPLILVFIRGTWCPFCRMHLSRLRNWMNNLQNKKSTVIIVSTETPEVIQEWVAKNPSSYIFASDSDYHLANYFGVHIVPNDFANAATFLIDTDRVIKLSYIGKRTNKNFEEINQAIK